MSETTEDNIQVLFKSAPDGLPTEDNFEIKHTPIPSIGEGQFLLRNLYLSLDPYQRMLMGGGWTYSGGDLKPGDLMVGRVLGEVIESKKKERRRRRKISGERRKRTNFLLQFPFNQAQKPQYQHRYPLDSGCSRI